VLGWLVFAVASLVLAWLTRASVLRPGSHGFFRFLAWEAMIALFLVVADRWFADPMSVRQIVSWLLFVASAVLALHGVTLLSSRGRPDERRTNEGLIAFERTTALVEVGAYRFIRHPMYASLLLLVWGAFLKEVSWPSAGLALAASVLLVITARVEERENVRAFGPIYEEYMGRTKMFLPFVF